MRLRACFGFLLLGLCACESLPSAVLIDVEGSTLQFKKKEPPASPANQIADDGDPR